MASKFLKEALADRSPETKIFVKKYLDFVERVHQLMEEKGMTQRELAEAIGQKPSAISRLLGSDAHNLTLKSIAKLEAYFGQEIMVMHTTDIPKYSLNTGFDNRKIIESTPSV
jgi:transcriptional regulator with XRE-family HTH domain